MVDDLLTFDENLVCVLAAQSAVKRTFIEAAIRKCGGNEQKGFQLYTAYGSTGQVSDTFLVERGIPLYVLNTVAL